MYWLLILVFFMLELYKGTMALLHMMIEFMCTVCTQPNWQMKPCRPRQLQHPFLVPGRRRVPRTLVSLAFPSVVPATPLWVEISNVARRGATLGHVASWVSHSNCGREAGLVWMVRVCYWDDALLLVGYDTHAPPLH